MGLIKAFSGALGGTFADQWKDIITASEFDEHVAVAPGIRVSTNNGRGSNTKGSKGIITNGSRILVPENTAAFVFSQSRIEEVIYEPGGYIYGRGQDSIFDIGSIKSVIRQIQDRFDYGGISPDNKQIAFVNLREIRGIKFGTHGPQIYNDRFYETDLEVLAHGTITIQVINPICFLRRFVPPNTAYVSFDDTAVKDQLVSEFLQSFGAALNALSGTYRISELTGHSQEICATAANDPHGAGSWPERFGLSLLSIAIENIRFSDRSEELVRQYSEKKMNISAYDSVSRESANIAAQQLIAGGIHKNGTSGIDGLILGADMLGNMRGAKLGIVEPKIDQQIETLKKLKELVDAGVLTQEEFIQKKSEIMNRI